MPIQPTNKDIGTRGITSANLSDFAGRDRQVVIQVDDPKGYRPVIMDGTTVGGKNKVVIDKDLEEYAKKSEIPAAPDLSPYATKENPQFTGTATLNAKNIATTDQIPDTSGFLTESDLTELEAGIADLQEQISDRTPDYGTLGALPDNNVVQLSNLKVTDSTLADYAGVNAQLVYNTDSKQWVSMDGVTQGGANTLVNAKGNRGNLNGFQEQTTVATSGSTVTINVGYDYPDVQRFVVEESTATIIIAFPSYANFEDFVSEHKRIFATKIVEMHTRTASTGITPSISIQSSAPMTRVVWDGGNPPEIDLTKGITYLFIIAFCFDQALITVKEIKDAS